MSIKVLLATEPELEREEVTSSSDRSFGYVFSIAFTVIGLWPLMDGRSPRYWALLFACVFILLASFAPSLLGPLNILWGRFGVLLHRIVTPIVMSAVFFLAVSPVAWIMRVLGKDPLRLKFDQNAKSYWIERQPAGPEPQSMTRQF